MTNNLLKLDILAPPPPTPPHPYQIVIFQHATMAEISRQYYHVPEKSTKSPAAVEYEEVF